MKPPVIQSADWFEKSRPPDPEIPVEERMLILERTVEVLRQELISQNKKIERLETALFVARPRRIVGP